MKRIKQIAYVMLAVFVWTAFVGYGFVDGFLLRPLTSQTRSEGFTEAVKEKLQEQFVGNFAMVLIEDGEVSKELFYSVDKPVDSHTVFPVASISKWVTSFGVLKLLERGKLELDRPVDDYLSRWHLPESQYDNKKVTVRGLLSHSSGLIDDLGYNGFLPSETVQTLEQSLTKAADTEHSEGVAVVGYEPGSRYMYSGAGYTILQLLIEEISGLSFQDYMVTEVFEPLNMQNSTFIPSEKSDMQLAQVYKQDGTTRAMNTFTALAAASLYTTAADLTKFMQAYTSSSTVLSEETLAEMVEPESFINGIGVYGLGPHLYSQNDPKSNIVGHDGSGNDAINTAARIDLQSNDGIIVLQTGNFDIASAIADEWMFWKVGIADYVVMHRNKSYLLTLLISGCFTILLLSAFVISRGGVSRNSL